MSIHPDSTKPLSHTKVVGTRRVPLRTAHGVCLLLMLHAAGVLAADAPLDVSKMLLRARPGDTVALPVGVFHAAIVLPEGVVLRARATPRRSSTWARPLWRLP